MARSAPEGDSPFQSSSAPQTADQPQTPSRGPVNARRRHRAWVVAGIAVASAVVAFLVIAHAAGGSGSHTLNGTFTSFGALPIDPSRGNGEGVPCRVQGADAAPGVAVTVTDHSGKELGLGSLTDGVEDATLNNCVFTFTVKVPDTDFYNVQVGSGNPVSFTRSDLKARGWHVGISNTG